MKSTVADVVTPHVLRIVDLANNAQNGANVDWHVRDAVGKTMGGLGDQFNGPDLVAAFVEGLEKAESQAPKARARYASTLLAAADAARRLRRD
jgi:hypothetical protein